MREIDYDPIIKAAYETANQIEDSAYREYDHATSVARRAVLAGLRTFAIAVQQTVMDGHTEYVTEFEQQALRARWNAKVNEQMAEGETDD